MRLFDIFPPWRPLIDEDCEAMAAAADNTMRMAKRQKAQAKVEKTKSTLATQQKQLLDASKSQPPRVG